MDILGVNALAVIITALIAFAFGVLWHSPVLFLKQWLRLMHISEKEMKKAKAKAKDMKPTYALAFLANLVLAWSVGFILLVTGGYGASAGLIIGGVCWLGFVATITLNNVLWEGKSWALWRFNNAYYLVLFLLVGASMGAWA